MVKPIMKSNIVQHGPEAASRQVKIRNKDSDKPLLFQIIKHLYSVHAGTLDSLFHRGFNPENNRSEYILIL